MSHSTRDERPDPERPIPRAKITTPRIPDGFIARDGLRDSLTGLAAEFPVVTVCAPAGHGKTLLLADWAAKTGMTDKAWVCLDAGDNDAGRFWTAVLSAARACAVVPESSRLRRLEPPGTPDTTGFSAEFIDALSDLPGPLYLVFDGLQEISSDETWHSVATLVRHQPKPAHLVLSTRTGPPLPLARLRVQGRLGEIRADELCFSVEEAAELIERAGVRLREDQVRCLVARTAGWPAGLRLAAQSLRGSTDHEAYLAEFAGNDRAISAFLGSEVLARFPAEATEVLQLVSVCDEVTPALAVALTNRVDAGAVLAGLERDGSLVRGVGPHRTWFRAHPLLRSHLRADLTRRRPAVVAELHETAATWFAAGGWADKAFDHIAHMAQNRCFVDLLRRHAAPLLLTGDEHGKVRSALTKFGTEEVAGNPWLALLSVLAHIVAGDHAEAGTELAGLALPADPGDELMSLHRLVATTHALVLGRPPEGAPADRIGVVAAQEGHDLEAWARLCLGWIHLCDGRRTDARRELTEAAHLSRDQGFDHLTLHCYSALALLSCSAGEFTTMESECAQAASFAASHAWRSSPWSAVNQLMTGLASLLRLNPAETLDRAGHAVAVLTTPAEPWFRYPIELVIGAAHYDMGRRQDALRLLRRARRDLHDGRLPPEVAVAGSLLEHRCAVDLGQDTPAVAAWARAQAGDVAEPYLMHAWTSFAHGDLGTTAATLRELLTGRWPVLCPLTLLEARLLETAVEIREDRRTKARNSLDAALLLAAPHGLIRPFHHADLSVRRLLMEQAGGFGRANGFAAEVFHALSTMDGRRDDRLTKQEHAVLTLLSSTKSIGEMASALSVSVNTVKTHIRAIYTKLGVHTRRAAVVAARQLGIG